MNDPRGVLVAGATSGIGLAVAAEFAGHGERVVIGGRTQERVDAAVEHLRRRNPAGAVHGVILDVRSRESVDHAVAEAERLAGSVNVLVNSAGIFPRLSLLELTDEVWSDVIETNLGGPFRCSRAVVPLMRDAGGGSIVNIGSIWAQHRWPNRSAYAASKAAVEQFTRALALELIPMGIRVNAVSPGIFRTGMTEGVLQDEAFVNTFMPRVVSGQVGDPETQLAGIVRFLTLDAASYMVGEVVSVHGGYY